MKLRLQLENIENGIATLRTEDGIAVTWPEAILPPESKPGDQLDFQINETADKGEGRKLAKEIINEILDVS